MYDMISESLVRYTYGILLSKRKNNLTKTVTMEGNRKLNLYNVYDIEKYIEDNKDKIYHYMTKVDKKRFDLYCVMNIIISCEMKQIKEVDTDDILKVKLYYTNYLEMLYNISKYKAGFFAYKTLSDKYNKFAISLINDYKRNAKKDTVEAKYM